MPKVNLSIDELKKRSTKSFTTTLAYALAVSEEIGRNNALKILAKIIGEGKIKWVTENMNKLGIKGDDAITAFTLEEKYISAFLPPGVYKPTDIKIVEKTPTRVVSLHTGYCATLEACKALNLKTSEICPILACQSWEMLYKRIINPKISMKLAKLRPHSEYCEEIIEIA